MLQFHAMVCIVWSTEVEEMRSTPPPPAVPGGFGVWKGVSLLAHHYANAFSPLHQCTDA